MSQTITITLTDEMVGCLSEKARARGQTIEEFASESLQSSVSTTQPGHTGPVPASEERFVRWIGSVNLGHPTGDDNESIDADLARQYARAHEDSD